MNDPRSLQPLSNQPAERRSLWWRALDWLMPVHCVVCDRAGASSGLCDGCLETLPRNRHSCRICAIELPATGVCGECLSRPPAFDQTIALFRYEAPVDRLVQSLKYGHDLSVGRAFGRLLAKQVCNLDVDRIIPVPLHRRRLAERGFNQSVELGRPIRALHRWPMDVGCVRRVRETVPQAGLKLKARRRNLSGAFQVVRRVDAETILVVDDVMTSGATLDRLAAQLKRAGAARVINLVCARTPADR